MSIKNRTDASGTLLKWTVAELVGFETLTRMAAYLPQRTLVEFVTRAAPYCDRNKESKAWINITFTKVLN